jgi:hypothetical protein
MRKTLLLAALVAAAGAALWYGVREYRLSRVPTMPKSIEDTIAVLNSPQFEHLPDARKEAYFDRAQELMDKASPQQKKALDEKIKRDPDAQAAAREAFYRFIEGKAIGYVHSNETERLRELDQVLLLEKMTLALRQREPTTQSATQPEGGDSSARRPGWGKDRQQGDQRWLQDKIERGNPQKQAYIVEFIKDLRMRRTQLGLPEPQ